jgi:hypothetical protein
MEYGQLEKDLVICKEKAKVRKHHLKFLLTELFGKHVIDILLSRSSSIKSFAVLFPSNQHLVALAHLAA